MSPEADSVALGCTQQYYQTPKYQLFRSPHRRELTWNFLQKKGQIVKILASEGLKIELTLSENISNMRWVQKQLL